MRKLLNFIGFVIMVDFITTSVYASIRIDSYSRFGFKVKRAEEREILKNGSFEVTEPFNSYKRVFPGWSWWNCSVSFDKEEKKEGNQSLKVVHGGGPYSNVCAARPPLEPGRVYKISGWIKSDGKTTGEIALIYQHKPGWKTFYIGSIKKSTEWVYVEKVLPAWQKGWGWDFRLYVKGKKGGSVWFDGISMREVPKGEGEKIFSFKFDFEDEKELSGWKVKNGSISICRDVSYKGKSSLRIKIGPDAKPIPGILGKSVPQLNPNAPCCIVEKEVNIPIEKSKNYTLSGWVYGDGGARTVLRLVGDKGDVFYTNRPKSYEWQYLTKTVSGNAFKKGSNKIVRIDLLLFDEEEGFANLDDIQLTVGTKGTILAQPGTIISDFDNKPSGTEVFCWSRYCPRPKVSISSERSHSGTNSLKVSYRFVAEQPKASISFGAGSLGLGGFTRGQPWLSVNKISAWVYGDGSGIYLRFTKGWRRPTKGIPITWKGWKKVEIENTSSLGWFSGGGIGLALYNPTSEPKEGTIYIDDIEVSLPKLGGSLQFSIDINDSKPLHIYNPGEKIDLTVAVRNNTFIPQEYIKIRYEITDFWGNRLRTEEKVVNFKSSEKKDIFCFSYLPPKKGVYYFTVEVETRDFITARQISFGVLTPNKSKDPFFGATEGCVPSEFLYLPLMAKISGWKVLRMASFWVGSISDPYRFELRDVYIHKLKSCSCEIEMITLRNIEEIKRRAKHWGKDIKYWCIGGEDEVSIQQTKDPKKREEKLKKYLQWYDKAFKAIRKINPAAKLSCTSFNWWRTYCLGGKCEITDKIISWMKDNADFFTYHIRGGFNQIRGYDGVREIHFKKNKVNLPVWANESGVGGPIEAVIAPAFARYKGYERFLWFNGGIDYGVDRQMGFLDRYGYPKAAYFAYHTTIKRLCETEHKGEMVEVGNDVWYFQFKKKKRRGYVYILFANDGLKHNMVLKGAKKVTLIDIMNNEKTLTEKEEKIIVSVSSIPVFIESNKKLFFSESV